MSLLDMLVEKQGNKCHYCQCEMNREHGSLEHATIEHLLDKWSSPKHQKIEDESNLVAACYKCNNTRGNERNKIARAFYKAEAARVGKKIAVASTSSKTLFKLFGAVPQHLFD